MNEKKNCAVNNKSPEDSLIGIHFRVNEIIRENLSQLIFSTIFEHTKTRIKQKQTKKTKTSKQKTKKTTIFRAYKLLRGGELLILRFNALFMLKIFS